MYGNVSWLQEYKRLHDYRREWGFVILRGEEENALQFVKAFAEAQKEGSLHEWEKNLNNLPKYWKPEIAERVAERFHGKWATGLWFTARRK